MFGLFKKKPPADPPTQRQLNYAKRLGVTVTLRMSKQDVSAAISAAEAANPKAKRQREKINAKQAERAHAEWVAECGQELIDAVEHWTNFADDVRFMLAIYDRGKNTIVDVLEVNDAYIDGTRKKKLKLCLAAPKVVKDRHIGNYLEWEREFELPLEKLLHYEPLHSDFCNDGNDAYKKVVERGLKTAKRMAKAR